jgi:hypothetical protein
MHCRGLQKIQDCRGQGREAEGRRPYSLTFIHVQSEVLFASLAALRRNEDHDLIIARMGALSNTLSAGSADGILTSAVTTERHNGHR